MQNIKSIIIGLSLAVAILLAIVITIGVVYEDEVSQYLVQELNENILSEIEVDEINFSLVRKFPKASLEFKNVIAFSKSGHYQKINGLNTDTLFYAKSLYVQLNLIDIISKNYTITNIHFDQGKINLFVDRFGDPNYIFWDKPPKGKAKDLKVELKEVKITESEVLYYNDVTNILINGYVNKIDFEGNFSKQNYLMKIKSNIFIEGLAVNSISYIESKNIKTNINLDILNNEVQFKNSLVNLQSLKFGLNGTIQRFGNRKLDLLISGKDLEIKSFIKNLPYVIVKEFPSVTGEKGKITLNLSIAGENMKTSHPHIKAMFILSDAEFFEESRGVQLNNIYIDGEFDNGHLNNSKTSKISFKTFQFNMVNNWFKGVFELRNLTRPIINLDFETELYFEELKSIFDIDTLEVFKGFASGHVRYNGTYENIKSFSIPLLFTEAYSFNLNVNNGEIKLKGKPFIVNNISGDLNLSQSVNMDNISFNIGESDFLINGTLSNLYEYLNEGDILNSSAVLKSRKINLNELAYLFVADKTEQNNSSYQFPDKLSLRLNLNIENFEAGKFNAASIIGSLNYKPRMFSLHEIKFNSMNGKVKAGGVIIQKFNNDFLVKSKSRLENININNLFYSFNNFGQSFITNKNLDGNLTGDVYFTSEWSDKLKIYKETFDSDCDVVIVNGELNDFAPMMNLSRFIEMEDLKNVKFSKFNNTISIENEKIIIPEMDIESSVLNFKASGEHHFNSSYTYHTELLLSDLLSAKLLSKKRKKQAMEVIEEDKEGRITLYLLIEGNKDRNEIRYDRKMARGIRRKKLKSESEELKQILNEEYGWFKNDSFNVQPSKEESKFQLDFDEIKKRKKNNKPDPENKFIIEWEEDTTKIE